MILTYYISKVTFPTLNIIQCINSIEKHSVLTCPSPCVCLLQPCLWVWSRTTGAPPHSACQTGRCAVDTCPGSDEYAPSLCGCHDHIWWPNQRWAGTNLSGWTYENSMLAVSSSSISQTVRWFILNWWTIVIITPCMLYTSIYWLSCNLFVLNDSN